MEEVFTSAVPVVHDTTGINVLEWFFSSMGFILETTV